MYQETNEKYLLDENWRRTDTTDWERKMNSYKPTTK